MLSAHYRSPINFSKELMESAKSALGRIYTCLETLDFLAESAEDRAANAAEEELIAKLSSRKAEFIAAMDDDLNTADAISVIFELVADVNKVITENPNKDVCIKCAAAIRELGDVLGLLGKKEEKTDDEVQSILEKRAEARAAKDWAKSDELRDRLKDMGYSVKDTPQGQQLTRI